EVDRAAKFVKTHAQGKHITRVDTTEDNIVYSGLSHTEFANEITNRKVKDVKRYGKVFFLELEGEGRMPVLHFGMTGNIFVKGEEPLYYREGPKKGNNVWPPRFYKFIIHLSDAEYNSESETQIAFVDARRLGRIRLCREPVNEPPISSLGFDPILCMPPLEEFSKLTLKRTCPIKALLLDQSFSAGVGNWVADEILYHAQIHPEQKCHTLNEYQLSMLHEKTIYVCQTAVSVNADSSRFPESWLFVHRWGKGKNKKEAKGPAVLKLSSGEPATIKWITVGGRTSAFVAELQRLVVVKDLGKDTEQKDDEDSELTSLSDEDEKIVRTRSKHKTRKPPQKEIQPKGQKRQKRSQS
ncbi:AtMMH-1, partial [Phellopilus nigrolimitatus]